LGLFIILDSGNGDSTLGNNIINGNLQGRNLFVEILLLESPETSFFVSIEIPLQPCLDLVCDVDLRVVQGDQGLQDFLEVVLDGLEIAATGVVGGVPAGSEAVVEGLCGDGYDAQVFAGFESAVFEGFAVSEAELELERKEWV